MKAPALKRLSRLNHTAFVFAVYASHFGHPNVQDSLPAAGQALPDGIRTHWVIKDISKII
jgi:hypothetical protein